MNKVEITKKGEVFINGIKINGVTKVTSEHKAGEFSVVTIEIMGEIKTYDENDI